jgi:hypothetical protein
MAARKSCDIRDLSVTVAELAEMFSLTPERIRQLIKLDVLERDDAGGLNVQASIINYERFLLRGLDRTSG